MLEAGHCNGFVTIHDLDDGGHAEDIMPTNAIDWGAIIRKRRYDFHDDH